MGYLNAFLFLTLSTQSPALKEMRKSNHDMLNHCRVNVAPESQTITSIEPTLVKYHACGVSWVHSHIAQLLHSGYMQLLCS